MQRTCVVEARSRKNSLVLDPELQARGARLVDHTSEGHRSPLHFIYFGGGDSCPASRRASFDQSDSSCANSPKYTTVENQFTEAPFAAEQVNASLATRNAQSLFSQSHRHPRVPLAKFITAGGSSSVDKPSLGLVLSYSSLFHPQ